MLAYLDVPHDVPAPPDTETAKNVQARARKIRRKRERRPSIPRIRKVKRFQAAVAKKNPAAQSSAPTEAFGEEDAVAVPDLAGTNRSRSYGGMLAAGVGAGADWERSGCWNSRRRLERW